MLLIQNELTKVFDDNISNTKEYLELVERKSLRYSNSLYLYW